MSKRNVRNFPARVLALALILGAASAGAETDADVRASGDEPRDAAIEARSRELALEAHRTEAGAAAAAVLEANRADLDIRLIGRRSVTVVSES